MAASYMSATQSSSGIARFPAATLFHNAVPLSSVSWYNDTWSSVGNLSNKKFNSVTHSFNV